jgi:DNA (cytosine-5)-methyltransferase 1
VSSAYPGKAARRELPTVVHAAVNSSIPGLFDEPIENRSSPVVLERFHLERDWVVRTISRSSGPGSVSRVRRLRNRGRTEDPAAAFDASWLRAATRPPTRPSRQIVRIADLFSGCGGMSLGAFEACRALGMQSQFVLAADVYPAANDVYRANFSPSHVVQSPIEQTLDGKLGEGATAGERAFKRAVGSVDVVVSGPPCQGHSDLNNHTRRADPKNQLVLRVVRFAELFRPKHLLIENVQGILHDRHGVIDEGKYWLQRIGYRITEARISADTLGIPQRRRRYFLFASMSAVKPLNQVVDEFPYARRTIRWAIEDLCGTRSDRAFDQASVPTPANRRRIEFLFDRDLYDLPDKQRPACHATGDHTYKAVYGRLTWDNPCPTITTGFGCMGQGRFVHPAVRRTLTPHEAARLQFFPDFFEFGERRRGEYQQLIGNAVPPKLAYALLVHQLA